MWSAPQGEPSGTRPPEGSDKALMSSKHSLAKRHERLPLFFPCHKRVRGKAKVLGAKVPTGILFTKKPKEWTFHSGNGGDVVRHVGVEIEFHDFLITPSAESVKALHAALSKWGGSVVQDHSNVEVQLAPASGERFREQVEEICGLLKTMKAKCSTISGLHIHVDARDMKFSQLGKVMVLYAKMEPLLIRTQPYSRMAGKFCRPTGKDLGAGWSETRLSAEQAKLFDEKAKAWIPSAGPGLTHEQVARYKAVNFAAWYKYSTIEVRFHAGTLNAEDIISWASFWSNFVEYAATHSLEEITALKRTQTDIRRIVGLVGYKYVRDRLALYRDQWSPLRVERLIPKSMSAKRECDLCADDGIGGSEAAGTCCDMNLCQTHLTDH